MLENIFDVAKSGIDRISTGAPTHTSSWIDIGLDWDSVSFLNRKNSSVKN
jgi:nicotinate-nucleotide pyrophosphorylase